MESSGLPAQSFLRGWRWVLCFGLLLALPGSGQNGPPQYGHMPRSLSDHSLDDDQGAPGDPNLEEKRLRLMNADRQKSLVSDTAKLLKLAHDLDSEITAVGPDSLTADQIRKLEEIEKLAHSVKEKMRLSMRASPVYLAPPPVFPR
jgi:hypothetical protein